MQNGTTLAGPPDKPGNPTARFGVPGLDLVLKGGLTRARTYLVEGFPGTGKTTLGMQFLLEGVRAAETAMLISLSETEEEIRATAKSHGWDLAGLRIAFLSSADDLTNPALDQSLLYSSDLELGETTRRILTLLQEHPGARVVIDSLSELRLLAQSSLRYRRQLMALKQVFGQLGQTVLMLDDLTAHEGETTLHSLVHGVVRLTELAPVYGAQRRQLRVTKYRGVPFLGGFHDMDIRHGGLAVYPRLVASGRGQDFVREDVSTGIDGLDALLRGGITRGTTTMLVGPAGAGKSVLAMQAVAATLARGERAAVFAFEEDVSLLLARLRGVGLDFSAALASGQLVIEQVDPAEQPPGAFAECIRGLVAEGGVRCVLIDSLNGYYAGMPQEQYLVLHMHELTSFLNRHGALTVLTVAQHGLIGEMRSPVDLTYLSDTLLLMRFFEAEGALQRAISVVKKRSGPHGDGIHKYTIGANGLYVGNAMSHYAGVLRGDAVRIETPTIEPGANDGALSQRVAWSSTGISNRGADD